MREGEIQLKRLGFLRTFTVNVVVLVSNIYDYAKENSGSLKPSVDKAESAVAAVVSPIYERFKGVPSHLLLFLDTKVFLFVFFFNYSFFLEFSTENVGFRYVGIYC